MDGLTALQAVFALKGILSVAEITVAPQPHKLTAV